jgi:hypothetical protein
VDLSTVIDQSLENAGLTESGVEVSGPEPSEPAAEPAAPEGAEPDAAIEAGAPEGDPAPPVDTAASDPVEPVAPAPKKKQGPIPFDKHEKVLTNERTKHATELKAVNDRLANVAWAEHPEARARVQAMGAAETHPELFAKAILGDPRLGPIFKQLIGAPAGPAAAPAAPVASERPKPDTVDAAGNAGYSEAGLAALLDWTAAQGAAQAQKVFEERYGKEIEPLVKERKTKEQWAADVQRADTHIQDARKNWDGFTDAEPAIKKFLLDPANVSKSLFDAYMAVVVRGKLKTDRSTMRNEILAEMNGKAKVAQAKPAAVTTSSVNTKRSIEDVINASIEGLE